MKERDLTSPQPPLVVSPIEIVCSSQSKAENVTLKTIIIETQMYLYLKTVKGETH